MVKSSEVRIETHSLAGLPVLHAAPAALWKTPLPTVLVYHGFTRSKELDSNLAFMLAQAGLRALMPEIGGHGARFDGNASARLRQFWPLVRQSIDEIPDLVQALRDNGWMAEQRVGVAGLSMGGFIALGALARHEVLQVGVSWMGSGHFLDLSRKLYPPLGSEASLDDHDRAMAPLITYDPIHQLDQLSRKPLLLWHGKHDEVVPVVESERLYAALRANGLSNKLELIVDPQAGHKLNDSGARCGVDFLQVELQAQGSGSCHSSEI